MYLNMDKENPSCLRAYLNSNPALNPNYHYYLTMYTIDYFIAPYFTMYSGDELFGKMTSQFKENKSGSFL